MAPRRVRFGGRSDGRNDYWPVHDDISMLADYGLLFVVAEERSKRPYLPYERIHLDIELVGGEPSEEPAPA